MTKLGEKIAQEISTLSNLKELCFQIIKHMNQNNDFTFNKISIFFQLHDILKSEFFDSIFENVKRIYIFEKLGKLLESGYKEIF